MNLYQEHILDHYHNPKNWGQLKQATHQSDIKNPTCGDTLHLELRVSEEKVEEIAWTGEGCAISLASASLLSEQAAGKTTAQLLALTPSDVLKLLELNLSPGRLKCGILSLEALHTALNQEVKKYMSQWKDEAKPAGPVTLKNGWTIEVDQAVCIGAAVCTAIASKTFALDENNKASILATADEEEQEAILNAARACPVSAIRIKDASGQQIFPV